MRCKGTISFILFCSLLINTGCNNDIDILAPHKEIPLVYCVLDQNDSVHTLRLQRSFAGEGNAWSMAKISDSIYYNSAHVFLERWSEREFSDKVEMIRTESVEKDSGAFASTNHILYSTNTELNTWSEYKISVAIPAINMELSSSTFLVGKIKLVKPRSNQPSLSFSEIDKPWEVEWESATNARIYFLQIRFNYLEVYGRDTTTLSQKWSIAHFASQTIKGDERMETLILKKKFYQFLSAKIPPLESGVKRIVNKKALDIIFTIGGEELYTYLQVHDAEHNPMIQKPVYTNIENGVGIFSARTTQEVKGKALTYLSIDSIAYGQYTKKLGFVDSTDDYYRK